MLQIANSQRENHQKEQSPKLGASLPRGMLESSSEVGTQAKGILCKEA